MCQTSPTSTFEEEFEHSLDKGDYLNSIIKFQQKSTIQEAEVSNTLSIPVSLSVSQPILSPQPSLLYSPQASNINFIKNLIKLIRMWVKVDKMEKKGDRHLTNLWKLFNTSKKHNKSLFRVVYGGNGQNNQSLGLLFEQFGELNYFKEVGYEQIKQFQHYLRNQTVKQILQADINHIIKNRRVQNKQEFEVFLHQFLAELKEGDLKLRQVKNKNTSS